jgi:hypothetical protein
MFRSSSPHYVRCTVQIEDAANLIICDQCKVSEADSERFAVAEGWLVDYSVNPTRTPAPSAWMAPDSAQCRARRVGSIWRNE